jgi:lipoate-protein ligase A
MNMALDRAVLASHAAGGAPPTLRLYRWQMPTVTLGRFQPVAQVDLEACARHGFDVVRRPTGGRGVLHDEELTYSFVAGVADGVPRGVAASYRRISAALAEAYRTLGVTAELTTRQRGKAGAGACYLHATQADLSLGAAKLSGSAQVWKDYSVLQHGSFVVARDIQAESKVFRLDREAQGALAATTSTLQEALADRPTYAAISEAVVDAFECTFGVVLERSEMSAAELDQAEEWAPFHVVQSVPREA